MTLESKYLLFAFSSKFQNLKFFVQAAEEMRSVDESIGSGKLYFTGTGYTVNLIPHAIVLGLLALGEPPPPAPLLARPPPSYFQRNFLTREQGRKNDCIVHWCEKWN